MILVRCPAAVLDRARRRSVDGVSMTNEDHSAEWEIGDSITIRLDPEEPETDDAAEADAEATTD